MADEAPIGPAWGYREGEAKIFDDGVLPKGWVDSPAKLKPAKAEKPAAETVDGGAGDDTVKPAGDDTVSGATS